MPGSDSKPHKLLIGCFRELQNSIKDSVHRLLKEQIEMLGLSMFFSITEKSIRSLITGSEFIFKGIRSNTTSGEMKSLEGVDIAWVEEAHLVSEDSWTLLIPTIRKEGSELWISFDPNEETDATYKRFVLNPPPAIDDIPQCSTVKVGWQDNPWFPEVLDRERQYLQSIDPEAYGHVWEGECRLTSEANIFKPIKPDVKGGNYGEYAEEHIRQESFSPAQDAKLYSNYMEYYRQRRLTAIHGGLLNVRGVGLRNPLIPVEVSSLGYQHH